MGKVFAVTGINVMCCGMTTGSKRIVFLECRNVYNNHIVLKTVGVKAIP
jgi:hypothetical protein